MKKQFKTIIDALNANVGSWYTQEQIAEALIADGFDDSTPKTAQAALSKLFSANVVKRVDRKRIEGLPITVGRFVYRVEFPVDSSKIYLSGRTRITTRRGTKRQLDLLGQG